MEPEPGSGRREPAAVRRGRAWAGAKAAASRRATRSGRVIGTKHTEPAPPLGNGPLAYSLALWSMSLGFPTTDASRPGRSHTPERARALPPITVLHAVPS